MRTKLCIQKEVMCSFQIKLPGNNKAKSRKSEDRKRCEIQKRE